MRHRLALALGASLLTGCAVVTTVGVIGGAAVAVGSAAVSVGTTVVGVTADAAVGTAKVIGSAVTPLKDKDKDKDKPPQDDAKAASDSGRTPKADGEAVPDGGRPAATGAQ